MDVDLHPNPTGQLIRDPAGSGPCLDIFVAVEENVSNRYQISVVDPNPDQPRVGSPGSGPKFTNKPEFQHVKKDFVPTEMFCDLLPT
jgi:hypothetical protein